MHKEMNHMSKRLVIMGIAILVMIVLVSCMGEEYGNEARSFLHILKRMF